VEDQGRAAAVTPAGPPGRRGWVVSPGFDLLFLANVLWPVALLPHVGGAAGPLTVWQLYFLTTPHRWLTLVLVAADPDRREGRDRLFLGLAALAAGAVLAVYLSAGNFACLVLIDLVWNGWHFGSQHAGVLRMYGRKAGGGWPWLERHGVRLFVFYLALRAPAWVTGLLRPDPYLYDAVRVLDLVVLAVPVTLLAANLADLTRDRLGKLAYLVSVCVLYSGFLLAVRAEDGPLALGFALGSAVFHATEYLAVVTAYAWRRTSGGSAGRFRAMATNWLVVLSVFAVGLGTFAALWGTAAGQLWVGLNLTAAFLHYAYDGMIWKLRRPATAAALGVGAPA
jgi:hypothetical protein